MAAVAMKFATACALLFNAAVAVDTSSSAGQTRGPEDQLAQEMTHDLEMNFNKIAPFGKEDTAKELQDHAAKTQDTLVDAVENAEVAEIKRAVFRALTRLRAATIKEFDTIARLETQAIDAYNDAHHYRAENPLAHLHEDEAPVETDKLNPSTERASAGPARWRARGRHAMNDMPCRAATIKEFDTIARLETQAIDAYNDAHHYRGENPLAHLHEDEAPVETDKLKSFH
eukprot:CAMPEP_0171187388 /NCGR_PEP_ID=MMETSP0790-20130122/17296_1 /TAXON_ID=2925 /ORGANISM="Alexandrium catenella, Strain OF101" /LENGTH=228 /DNA_ID=CAMNT_0011652449 /DNA_START=73 /DNA_END=761 /DNA_ORIENTATION=-